MSGVERLALRHRAETDPARPFTVEADGVRLALRLTPRAGRNGLGGIVIGADGRPALHVRLTAPPMEGAANKALIVFLAQRLGLRRVDISIRSGETARLKILLLAGEGAEIARRLAAWIENPSG